MKRQIIPKLALLLFGLLLGLVLLEAGLRTAGFIVLYFQDRSNRQALAERSEYVILCLGESTTAVGGEDSYPRQLERTLNEREPGRPVKVVNKGVIGTNSAAILARLPGYLAEYRPGLVITMMGINEGLGTADPGAAPPARGFFRSLRVYKLFRHFRDRVAYTIARARRSQRITAEAENILALADKAIDETKGRRRLPPPDIPEAAAENIEAGDRHFEQDGFEEAIPFYRAALEADPGNTAVIIRLAQCLREMGSFREDRELLRRLLSLEPGNPEVYLELGNSFREEESWAAADIFYRRALDLDPKLGRVYWEQGHIHRRLGNSENAIPLFRKAIELEADGAAAGRRLINLAGYFSTLGDYGEAEETYRQALEAAPGSAEGYAQLGRFYAWRNRPREAETMCRRAVEIDPANELAWAKLGDICRGRGELEEAEEMYQKALDINPLNNIAFRILAVRYLEQEKFAEVEELCGNILAVDPRHEVALSVMAVCCQAQGKKDSAEEYFSRVEKLRTGRVNPRLATNYQKVWQMVREREIPLVCVQYPVRNVVNLKRMFPNPDGIIFVDNETVFKTALEAGSYGDLFTDCFAGDFGHCTPRGNRLLAENIAASVLPLIRGEGRPDVGE